MNIARRGDQTRRPPHFHLSSRVPSAEWSTRVQEKTALPSPVDPRVFPLHLRDYEVREWGALCGLSASDGNDEGEAQPRFRSHTCESRDTTVWLAALKECHPLFISAETGDRLGGGQVQPALASRLLTPGAIGRLWPPRSTPKGSPPEVRIRNWSSLTPVSHTSCNRTSPGRLPPQ